MTTNPLRLPTGEKTLSVLFSLLSFIRYNARQIFAGKFIYFLAGAVALFLLIVVIAALTEQAPPTPESVYYFLLAPGVLLIFYPAAFALQHDVDSGMLETLFGIPNYRYKVWLARTVTSYFAVVSILFGLALFCRVALADFSVMSMTAQLIFPIMLLGSIGFMFSTITRSGNTTAVIMILVCLFFWIAAEPLAASRWNLFHNPFVQTEQLETYLWSEITFYNRVYILVGSAIATLYALLRLQKREKFI